MTAVDVAVGWLLVIALPCSIVCSIVLGYLLVHGPAQVTIALKSDLRQLEWRSSYIDFDVLYAHGHTTTPRYSPIVNHARAVAQVSSTRPYSTMGRPSDYVLFSPGNMTVDNRRLRSTFDDVSIWL